MSGERTFLTANCSFVTSFPSIVGDPVNDQGLFRIGVSDGVAAAVNLGDDIKNFKLNDYDTEKEDIKKLLKDKEQNAAQIQEKEKAYANNQSIIYNLFEKSINTIIENSDENTVVGMQELNNTEQVHKTIQVKLFKEGRNSFFVCNNVHDPTGGTYATLGYILPDSELHYVPLDNKVRKIFRNTPTVYDYEDIDGENEFEKIKSFSVDKMKNSIMAIRDLGKASKIEPIEKDSNLYALKGTARDDPTTPNTDSGRPISMVIRGTEKDPKEIYINCHMLNASILKIFKKENDIYTETNQGSLLTNSGEKIGNTKTGDDVWFDYCIKRLEETLNELLQDFGSPSLNENTKVYIMGDFNDPEGKLLDYLEENPITMGGQSYKFIFGDKLETCCPNTNSAKEEKSDDTIGKVKTKAPFNRGLRDYIDNKVIEGKQALVEAKRIYGLTPIFKGDNIGKGYLVGGKDENEEAKKKGKPVVRMIEKKTSDHGFVTTYKIPVQGGKRRTRRRRTRRRSSGKRRMSRRRRGRRSTRRKR